MGMSKRDSGNSTTRTRRRHQLRPGAESLERRALLAAFDLINIAGTSAATGLGVQQVGINNASGAGFSSAMLGDVNGDGFNDFLIGAPFIDQNAFVPELVSGDGVVYLVFGSANVNNALIDFLTLEPQQRIGDLAQLGNSIQNNPINGLPGFAFNGLTIIASQNPLDNLGASVASLGDIDGDGFADFLIGAPGALDSTGALPGTGRAYLIYGGAALSTRTNKILDLDNPGANADLNIMTFVNNQSGAQTGRSVAGVGDVITDGLADIAIGAPNASFNSLAGNGAVYVINGGFLRPKRSQVVNLSTVGQGGSGDVPGVIFAGALSGDQAGFSVAGVGNVDGDRLGGLNIDDILIGATQRNTSAGAAFLVYGASNLPSQAILNNGVFTIALNRVVPGGSTSIPGAVFVGDNNGDLTGFSVSSAGDFNADGLADFMIGSPFWDAPTGSGAGRVNLIFGRGASPNPPGRILGIQTLSGLPANINALQFNGASPFALAGFSIAPVGTLNNDSINEILIGSPGFNNSQGIAYAIPGNPDLFGQFEFNLTFVQAAPLLGNIFTLSQPASFNYLGSSVSGSLLPNGSGLTMDGDSIADFIIGAAGFNLAGGRPFAGAGYALEGARVPLSNIVSTAITSPIGVGDVTPPFIVNPTTPDDLTFFILSAGSNTPGFAPPFDINPDTITVNGVALPDPGTFQNVGDVDGDGIDDAAFIFSPRSLLNLTPTTRSITISARTLTTSPFPNRRYTGTAAIRVSSTPVNPGGSPALPLNFGGQFQNPNLAAPQFGERFLPASIVVGRSRWAGLPPRLAYRQFVAQGAFGYRLRNAFHPIPSMQERKGRTRTLGAEVFTRGRFKPGVHFGKVNHDGPVIGAGNQFGHPRG